MAELISIGKSVGAGGSNQPLDVGKIGAALVAIGPDRGGIYAVPLSIGGLAEAIRMFQEFQKLPARDGRVDPGGKTLKKINEILNPGAFPIPPMPPRPNTQTGEIRNMPEMSTSINKVVWSPIESSLISEMAFKWNGVSGSGNIFYFELDEDVVPNWFGVLVPTGVISFDHVHIFFHPTPAQAGYIDANYKSKAGWKGVFHYMTDDMAVQFCAAQTGQVLVMPLMTQSAAGTCGIFPERWESIVGQMLGQIAGGISGSSSPQAISSVVVSSFSSGITYSAAFRNRANLDGKLRGVIDFDGIISSYRDKSRALSASAVRMWQTGAAAQTLTPSAAQNLFPLPHPRWKGSPYILNGNVVLQIHAVIPQSMMFVAAGRTAAR
jgi:hypothetical protein